MEQIATKSEARRAEEENIYTNRRVGARVPAVDEIADNKVMREIDARDFVLAGNFRENDGDRCFLENGASIKRHPNYVNAMERA